MRPRFTERGVIKLRVSRQQVEGRDWVAVSVTDPESGMSPDQVDRLVPGFRASGCLYDAQARGHWPRAGDRAALHAA
jgi:signal transduction histidine kinase